MSVSNSIMPLINPSDFSEYLSQSELDIVKRTLWAKRLRSNRPKVSFHKEGYIRVNNSEDAQAAYLWALCAYFISPYKTHGAYLPDPRWIKNVDRLQEISKLICDCVPKEHWYGLISRGEM